MNNENWIEVSTNSDEVWDGKAVLQGVYLNKKDNVGPNESTMYFIKTKDSEVGVWGSTVINNKMALVPFNSEIVIEPLGIVKSEKTGRQYKDYAIKYRPVPFQEVGKESSSSEPLPEEPIDVDDIEYGL